MSPYTGSTYYMRLFFFFFPFRFSNPSNLNRSRLDTFKTISPFFSVFFFFFTRGEDACAPAPSTPSAVPPYLCVSGGAS